MNEVNRRNDECAFRKFIREAGFAIPLSGWHFGTHFQQKCMVLCYMIIRCVLTESNPCLRQKEVFGDICNPLQKNKGQRLSLINCCACNVCNVVGLACDLSCAPRNEAGKNAGACVISDLGSVKCKYFILSPK